MRSRSPWSRRSRRTSSSVSELLPAPPVPVMPSTGAVAAFAAASDRLAQRRRRRAVLQRRDDARSERVRAWRSPARSAVALAGTPARGRTSQAAHDLVDHALQAQPRPSSGE